MPRPAIRNRQETIGAPIQRSPIDVARLFATYGPYRGYYASAAQNLTAKYHATSRNPHNNILTALSDRLINRVACAFIAIAGRHLCVAFADKPIARQHFRPRIHLRASRANVALLARHVDLV